MEDPLGRGPLGSLRARARHELAELIRDNKVLRCARYPLLQRLVRGLVGGRSIITFLGVYLAIDVLAVSAEWAVNAYALCVLPGWKGTHLADFLTSVASYFIAAQVGILAIVSVAVAVVTLLSQRDDGASSRTDVRLYYVESFAYEVATSGVALLVVLSLQLFWPLQHIEHALGYGSADLSFKLDLTVLHAGWLTLNYLLFFQFITTTLRFVEPHARARMRERYSATVVIPRDITRRLLNALYLNAPLQLIGKDALSRGATVTFGHGAVFMKKATPEITTKFRGPSHLRDVWLRPVGYVLRRWHRRSPSAKQPQTFVRQDRFGKLAVTASFDGEYDGIEAWLIRDGGAPLSVWERLVLRHSFRFSPTDERERDLPSPDNFIEELSDKVIYQIGKSAITGFKSALDDLVHYHRFLLDAQATRDNKGKPLNFAQIGGVWERPDQRWIRQYRRIFEAAAEKIGSDPQFIIFLGSLAAQLFPKDAVIESDEVIKTILELGTQEVVVLEAWVTAHTVSLPVSGQPDGPASNLPGSDSRAYQQVLLNFVGSWETALKLAPITYRWKDAERLAPDEHWAALARSWAFIERHLHNSAYFFALAVWNGDEMGADRYRDLLLRWLNPFHAEVQKLYEFRNEALVTPAITSTEWARTEALVRVFRRFPIPQSISPRVVFGLILRGAHEDAIIISTAVVLGWFANRQQSSDIGARAAVLLLDREMLPGEGSNLASTSTVPSIFRSVFSLIVRRAISPEVGGADYAGVLDGLVRDLEAMSTRRMVPGRIYSGWGSDGVDSLAPELLAILAAHMPDSGDDGVLEWLSWFANQDALVAEGDTCLRQLIWSLQIRTKTLADGLDRQAFERSVHAFGPEIDVEDRRIRLAAILSGAVDALQNARLTRLRAMPPDRNKLAQVRDRIADALINSGPDIYCFQGFKVERSTTLASNPHEKVFREFDKGQFVTPAMSSADFNELVPLIVDIARQHLAGLVFGEFGCRPMEALKIDVSDSLEPYWRAVIDKARTIGEKPTVLVPHDEIGEEFFKCVCGLKSVLPTDIRVESLPNMPSGGGAGYLGTMEGVHVYETGVQAGTSILYSGACLRRITYEAVSADGEIAGVEFVEGENLEKSEIKLEFAQILEWSDEPIVRFELVNSQPNGSSMVA